jgi:hypothetical protein
MTVACGSHQNIGIDDKFWCVFHIAGDVSIRTDCENVNQILASMSATCFTRRQHGDWGSDKAQACLGFIISGLRFNPI